MAKTNRKTTPPSKKAPKTPAGVRLTQADMNDLLTFMDGLDNLVTALEAQQGKPGNMYYLANLLQNHFSKIYDGLSRRTSSGGAA